MARQSLKTQQKKPRLLARFRLNRGGHGSLATGDQKVLAKRVDLLDFQFRMFARSGQADTSTIRINFVGDFEALIERMAKQLPHHQDDVFVRMVIVVPQNDVVSGLSLGPLIFFGLWSNDGFSSECDRS